MQSAVSNHSLSCYLDDPSARGAAFIWNEQSQLRVGLVSKSTTRKYLQLLAFFMSTEKEREGDERRIAAEGADVKQKKSKVTVCLDFYLNDLRYHVLPDAELGLILR